MYLKDYERKIILEKGGQYSDDDSINEDEERDMRETSPTYVEEQHQIRDSFRTALESGDSDSDDGFLTTKKKTKQEKDREKTDYKKWLKGETNESEGGQEMGALRNFWTDPDLDEGETFLRNYIVNREYIEAGSSDEGSEEGEVEDPDGPRFSEDEQALDDQDNFERKYNFRYEEPDAEFVKRFPRTISSSVRRKDTSRKEKRKEREQRKEDEKQRKHDELKKLKNIKKQEILDKLEQLREATGNAKIGFDPDELEEDFDPEKHDKMMQAIFNEEYDAQADDGIQPEYNQDDYGELEDDGNYGDEDGFEPHCDDPDFIMDADYDPDVPKKSKKEKKKEALKKKNRRTAGFGDVVKTDKPTFDPAEKTFDEYMDEYYQLDYEDIIDDLPCRFKYRTVMPNDFGLTVEEVLSAKDRELNQWVSVKKASQYRSKDEELHDIRQFRRRAGNDQLKRRIFKSFEEEISDEDNQDSEEEEEEGEQENLINDSANILIEEHDKEDSQGTRKNRKHSHGVSNKEIQDNGDKSADRNKKTCEEQNELRDDQDSETKDIVNNDNVVQPTSKKKNRRKKRKSVVSNRETEDVGDKKVPDGNKRTPKKSDQNKPCGTDDSDSGNETNLNVEHVVQLMSKKKNRRKKRNTVGSAAQCSDKSELHKLHDRNKEKGQKIDNVRMNSDEQIQPKDIQYGGNKSMDHASDEQKGTQPKVNKRKRRKRNKTGISLTGGDTKNLEGEIENDQDSLKKKQKMEAEGKQASQGSEMQQKQRMTKNTQFGAKWVTKQRQFGMKGRQSLRHKQQMGNGGKVKGHSINALHVKGHDKKGHPLPKAGRQSFVKKGGMSNSQEKTLVQSKDENVAKLSENSSNKQRRKQRKRKGGGKGKSCDPVSGISEARLKAYGVNPKKIRYQLEYQKQKQKSQV